jgi:L-amino acid N-acyltransferase YncA
MTDITIRRAGPLDARPIAELLNDVIEVGGTTAYTQPVSTDYIASRINEGRRATWHIAEDDSGELVGFQWIEEIDELPTEAASIATFARIGRTGLGIGSKLFAATVKAAKDLGYTWINADIRADNEGGLIYYQSRGFEDYGRKTGIKLENGLIVDKVLKRYDL